MATLTPSNGIDGQPKLILPPSSPKDTEKNGNVWLRIQFRTICEICVSMPLIGLVSCFIVSMIFQFEHIQETACKVYNVIPSISAVTGISPGRYLWRVVIAFHIGPRILIAAVYYNFLMSFVPLVASAASKASTTVSQASNSTSSAASTASTASKATTATTAGAATATGPSSEAEWLTKLLKCCYYLQLSEVLGLCVISFVHNREHYPTHEKGFLLYLTSSHLSFLIILRIYHMIWPFLNEGQRWSYYKKLFIFVFSLVCMTSMGYFYYRHIKHCDSFAFSIFAFAEYFVAAANMGYYWTLVNDLPDEEIVVKKPDPPINSPGNNGNNTNKELFPNQEIPQGMTQNGHPVITAADIAVKKDL